MSAVDETPHQNDTEPDQVRHHHHSRRFRRPPVIVGGGDVSISDEDSDDDQSWLSRFGSTAGGGGGGVSGFSSDIEGVLDLQRSFSESESLSEVDLESGVLEMKVHLDFGKVERRDCRICHLGLEGETPDCGALIELGCSCKGDLSSAHKQCAETWFKIKGDTTCEICGVSAHNVASERANDALATAASAPSAGAAAAAPVILVETIWHGRRIMNFLLACMVLAFITSWLFHFKILR